MVFVHARNATVRTAEALRDLVRSHNHQGHFAPEQTPLFGLADKQVRNKERGREGERERHSSIIFMVSFRFKGLGTSSFVIYLVMASASTMPEC